MSDRYFGTFYLVPPDAPLDLEDADLFVVRSYRHGPSHAHVARELLRLAGHEAIAHRIDEIFDRAHRRTEPVLERADLVDLLAALQGLEQRVGSALLDSEGRIRAEHMARLRADSRFLEFQGGDEIAPWAVSNALGRVASLTAALEDARDHGFHIALG